jgi:hypothetical protein
MFRTSSFRSALLATSLLALDLGVRTAKADDTDACLAAYEKAQHLRKDGRLGASREQLNLCVQPKCHALIKRDCSMWVAELEKAVPTIIVNARDASGKDLLAVRVLVDGAVLQDRLDGKPHEVDPGIHLFRFERDGSLLAEEKIVIQEGEKSRVINVKVAAGEPPSSAPATRAETSAPAPIGGFVLLGVGAVGASAFGILAALGQHELHEMRKDPGGCAPRCDPGRVDAARNEIIAANVSLGVGLVAAGLGTYLLLKPRRAATGLELGLRPALGGASTDLTYRF